MSSSDPSRRLRRGLRFAGIAGAVVAATVVATGVISRARGDQRLREWTEAQAIPTVAVAPPAADGEADVLKLPGRLEAYARAPIHARTSGYVKRWTADIGTPVKAGAVLAELETPELDQQLAQARADLATAQANARLAQVTAERWQKILQSNAVSKQDVDEKVGDLSAKRALVASAKANVDRYVAMKAFARLVAPFDGVVTARNIDVGALVSAGGVAGQELFVVSDTRKLRAYVNVPQAYVPYVPAGTRATLTVPEHRGRTYAATVESSAQAVNARSGTTLMQIGVDNATGELLPGAYADVALELPHDVASLAIPSSALIFDAKGLRVATVGEGDRVVLKPVTIARDFGSTIRIGAGLEAGDRVIQNPPDGVVDGMQVRIAGDAATAPGGARG